MRENTKKILASLKRFNKNLLNGHSYDSIVQQICKIIKGSNYINLIRPATVGDGIIKIDNSQEKILLQLYDNARLSGRILKFVPASGAATRMFSKLQKTVEKFYDLDFYQLNTSDPDYLYIKNLIDNIDKFAFYDDLIKLSNISYKKKHQEIYNSYIKLLDLILSKDGLNYLNKPKALIKFHKYGNTSRSAFIEQLVESSLLQADYNNHISIHFTISEAHLSLFEDEQEHIAFIPELNNYSFKISYSFQQKSTDSITLTEDNELFLTEDGKPFFRPAGHGALLENLNELNADIVFIKNIDNVCVDRLKPISVKYKKLLAGLLINFQNKIFEYLNVLEKKSDDFNFLKEIIEFAQEKLYINFPEQFYNWHKNQQREFLFNKLNRPIRVCGVVKNNGEPGGAPFWVKDNNGNVSLQIVEQSQVDFNCIVQKNIFNNSTHFNPVDIVAGLRDYKNNKFDLTNFKDEDSYMIVNKNIGTTKVQSLELPGLWNGAMADWISIFVEVPIETFNPVKELTDLLKIGHLNI